MEPSVSNNVLLQLEQPQMIKHALIFAKMDSIIIKINAIQLAQMVWYQFKVKMKESVDKTVLKIKLNIKINVMIHVQREWFKMAKHVRKIVKKECSTKTVFALIAVAKTYNLQKEMSV